MYACLLVAWLSLPLAPLNPIPQDTVDALNLHVTAGLTSPNGIVSAGPEISAKIEFRPFHPFILRGEASVRGGALGTRVYPDGEAAGSSYLTGHYQALTTGIDWMVYRGTDHLTAYFGLGVVYSFNHFSPDRAALADLREAYDISGVSLQQQAGYRVTIGIRYSRLYAFEVGITEVNPNFDFKRRLSDGQVSSITERTRFSNFRFTLGYILRIREW